MENMNMKMRRWRTVKSKIWSLTPHQDCLTIRNYRGHKNSNFNKGLGPDCFDGNVLQLSELLCSKVSLEIMDALNQGDIPDDLRVGRMVPL